MYECGFHDKKEKEREAMCVICACHREKKEYI